MSVDELLHQVRSAIAIGVPIKIKFEPERIIIEQLPVSEVLLRQMIREIIKIEGLRAANGASLKVSSFWEDGTPVVYVRARSRKK